MKKILVLALSLTMFCTACSTAWVSTLDSILAAAAPALVNILQIVAMANGRPMNSNLAAKINDDATVIKTLAGDFAKASSGSAPGICQQLQTASVCIKPTSNWCCKRDRSAIRTRRRRLRC